MSGSQYRRVPSGGRGHVAHAVYCAACPAQGVPATDRGWYFVEALISGRRAYYCPACGPEADAEEIARAAEPVNLDADQEFDEVAEYIGQGRRRPSWRNGGAL